MKKIISVLLILALAFCMVSCSEGNSGSGKDAKIPESVTFRETEALKGKRIGCSIVNKGDEWCSTVSDALEKLAAHYGAILTCEDGDMNDETQTKQIENMIANGVDLILVDPVTADGCSEALMKAVEKKIPIIIYDGVWTGAEQYAETSVTWDQRQTGVVAGEYLLDYIRKNMGGKATIVELQTAISTHCLERFVGLHETIDKADDVEITILGRYDMQGNRETAYNIISSLVDPYDFVVSDIDNGSNGAVAALQAAGNTKVKVLSMGGYGTEPFEAVHANDVNYLAFLNVDAWKFSELVINSTIDFFEGKTLEKCINFQPVMVDHTNAEEYWIFD